MKLRQLLLRFLIMKNNNFWPLLIIFVVSILASRTLIFESGYFNMHDDLQVMRQLSLEKCFLDGQFPCRWIPDMGYGYGFPLFNFYPPLPYLVGQLFRIFGFSFITTAKLLFSLSFLLSGLSMYFFSKEIFKNKWAGVLSSIFYIWAPYHAVDVYVRGAMNESWALIFFPLILLFSYKLVASSPLKSNISSGFWNLVLLALSWSGLLLSHNLMVMIFAPIFAIWCLLCLYLNKFRHLTLVISQLFISGLIALGLSAFFTLPAIFENNLTWLKTQLVGYYDYTAHFVSLNQLLFSRFWGYGPSVWLESDGMSFQIGWIHWLLPLAVVAVWLYRYFVGKRKTFSSSAYFLVPSAYLFIVGWFSAFMTHVKSTFVYQAFPFLGLVQFPWRFLTLVIFAFSVVVGGVMLIVPKKIRLITFVFMSLFAIIYSWSYFLPENGKMGPLTDQEKLSDAAWDLQRTAGIFDYLPLTAKENPKEGPKTLVEVVDPVTGDLIQESDIEFSNIEQGTNWAKFTAIIQPSDNSVVFPLRVNIFEFPGWKVFVNGEVYNHYVPEVEMWGRIWLEVPEGENDVELRFTNTPIRSVSNIISLISWLGLIGYILNKRKQLFN